MEFSALSLIDIELEESKEANLIDGWLAESEVPLTEEEANGFLKQGIDAQLIEELKLSNGRRIEWNTSNFRGQISLLSVTEIIQPPSSILELFKEDAKMDVRLRNLRLFDVASMNSYAGFLIDETGVFEKEVHYYCSGDQHAERLDLDFNGYVLIGCNAKFFPHWQKVIVDLRKDKSSPETEQFKEWMPKLFPDFSWSSFVEEYNKVRLSSQI